jgi:hypothetical protein
VYLAPQEYVVRRIKQFSLIFARELSPGASSHALDAAFSQAVSVLSGVNDTLEVESYSLQFSHQCRFVVLK